METCDGIIATKVFEWEEGFLVSQNCRILLS